MERSAVKAQNSSGSAISARVRLAATLRSLAGGLYLDIPFAFGIAGSVFFNEDGVLWPTVEAINGVEHIYFPVSDNIKLGQLADWFAAISRGRLPGCVMAIDGLAVQPWQPSAHEVDGNVVAYRNRTEKVSGLSSPSQAVAVGGSSWCFLRKHQERPTIVQLGKSLKSTMQLSTSVCCLALSMLLVTKPLSPTTRC